MFRLLIESRGGRVDLRHSPQLRVKVIAQPNDLKIIDTFDRRLFKAGIWQPASPWDSPDPNALAYTMITGVDHDYQSQTNNCDNQLSKFSRHWSKDVQTGAAALWNDWFNTAAVGAFR